MSVTIYILNQGINFVNPKEVLEIAIYLNQRPPFHINAKLPDGPFITERQWNGLPIKYKHMFHPCVVTIEPEKTYKTSKTSFFQMLFNK